TLIVVCIATFMLLLDITIVNVALPKIASDLKASFSDIQWVIDAYALTLASLLLTTGALADLLGRRLVFSVGLGLFALTSLLCALSPTALFLILARAGQGIGGAIMFSTSLALLAQEFHGRERGTAFGAYGAAIAASAAIGPLLGGALTQAFGWASIFYINVPVGIAALALSVAACARSSSLIAMFLDIVLFLQADLGLSPLQTGVRLLPVTLVSFVIAAISGNLSTRVPVRALLGIGLVLVGGGLLLMRGLTP